MRAQGLARGGSLDNAVVISDDRVLNAEGLRFADEFVRHKILDAMGDLYLAGGPMLGRYDGIRAGHAFNHALLSALFTDKGAWRLETAEAPAPETAAPAAPPNERSARMAAFFGDTSSPSPPPRAPSAADPRSRDERLAELRAAPPAEPEPEAAAGPAVPAAPEPEPPVEAEAAPAAEEAEPEPKKPKKKGPRDFGPSIGGLG